MNFTAKNVCNRAITVDATKMVSDARDTMLKHNISRIVIEHNQKAIGIVTEKGMSRYLYKESNDATLDKIVVTKAMTTPLISVTKDTDLRLCAKLMLDCGISSLVVKEGKGEDDEEFLNIFTKSDLVKLYADNYKGQFEINGFMTTRINHIPIKLFAYCN
jgi:CBS domain-containing protein